MLMARPRKTKVASSAARVVTSSSEGAPTSNNSKASKVRKTDSMAPAKRTRGRPPKFVTQKSMASEEIESSAKSASASQTKKAQPKKVAKKPVKKAKKSSLLEKMGKEGEDEDDEVEEPRASAADRLRARMGVPAEPASKRTSSASTRNSMGDKSDASRRSSPLPMASLMSHVAPTPQARGRAVSRGRTPSVQANTDDDLYGLSPAGKASQTKIIPRRSSVARRSSIPRAPMSALRVQGTPGMETSVLALQNFKRRPRQPSLIRMVQQSSELGREDEEALLGAESLLDDTLADFDNLLPQDESTPMNFGKKKKQAVGSSRLSIPQEPEIAEQEPRTSSSRKRKRDQVEEEDVQIPGSSPYGSSPPHIAGTTWARASREPSPSQERVAGTAEEEDPIYAEPMSQSDIMAPPLSSPAPSTKRQRTRGRPPKNAESRTTKQAVQKKAPKMSTAHLQALLPKFKPKPGARALKRTETYDVPSDDDEEDSSDLPDIDELSKPRGRARGRPSTKPTKAPLAAKKDNNRKATKKTSPAKTKQKRTYGRQTSVDKENDDSAFMRSLNEEDDDIGSVIEVAIGGKKKASRDKVVVKSKELEKARKMFAKVDEWEMEFESVDLGGGESSPWR